MNEGQSFKINGIGLMLIGLIPGHESVLVCFVGLTMFLVGVVWEIIRG